MKKKTATFFSVIFIALISFAFVQGSDWKAPSSAKALTNKVKTSSKSIKAGKSIFESKCIVCHGEKAKGDGPGGKALNPKPANLTSEKVQTQTDGEIFWKITNGRGAMVKWESIISETDRWNLVNFIRSVRAEKPKTEATTIPTSTEPSAEEKAKLAAQEKEANYKKIISEAEQTALVNDFIGAKKKYTEALALKPENVELLEKIKTIEPLVVEQEKKEIFKAEIKKELKEELKKELKEELLKELSKPE